MDCSSWSLALFRHEKPIVAEFLPLSDIRSGHCFIYLEQGSQREQLLKYPSFRDVHDEATHLCIPGRLQVDKFMLLTAQVWPLGINSSMPLCR